ncbi:YutD-like domain-containing protein [Lentilactobacillus kribbianus]|uniref:YutD-like domain-containing protein n=1 Tax=Lentilactobacillus kribbianus TaxID=2729622 RepID=UPI001554D78B|nr:YutD-like domain-containing protein [Lentilactobacillus kribbianus]
MDRNDLKKIIDERNEQRHSLGSITREDENNLLINDHKYQLIENHRDSFDFFQFEQHFNSAFSKFDYIVGETQQDQLLLRGFYEDTRENATGPFISQLTDIRLEELDFSESYYVIHNLEARPIPAARKSNSRHRRSRHSRRNRRDNNRDFKEKRVKKEGSSIKNNQGTKVVVKEQSKKGNHQFVIKERRKEK